MRTIAREIYREIADLPLVSMHGHLDATMFRDDTGLGSPAELFIIPDHYLTRMLVSQGYRHSELGIHSSDPEAQVETDHRRIWRIFCRNWRLFRGTPTRYWLEHELIELFGLTRAPSPQTADSLYDDLSEKLAQPEYRARELFTRVGIEVLSTTDPATSDLAVHAALAADGWGAKIVPTFRPDALFSPERPAWRRDVQKLSESSGIEVHDYPSFLDALRRRREAFARAGARASDHGHVSADTTPLDPHEAQRIFSEGLRGPVSEAAAHSFAANMLFETARMSLDDGLVMQLHPGIHRDYDPAIRALYGPDQGFDIPVPTDFVGGLRPLLSAFGLDPRFRMILFTVDEDAYSRELAPLAGAYPSVKLGAPWWFLDSPGGMARFRDLTAETAGFYNTSGFVDDTRSFASIPARHDLARRMDAGYLARLVAEHRLDHDEAVETAIDLSYTIPLQAYARTDSHPTTEGVRP